MAIGDFVSLNAFEISEILEIAEEEAQTLLTTTTDLIEKNEINLDSGEDQEIVAASAVPAYQGILKKPESENGEDGEKNFSDAERRLREELAAFKLK